MKKETRRVYKELAYYSSLGISVSLAIFIGLAIGVLLDRDIRLRRAVSASSHRKRYRHRQEQPGRTQLWHWDRPYFEDAKDEITNALRSIKRREAIAKYRKDLRRFEAHKIHVFQDMMREW